MLPNTLTLFVCWGILRVLTIQKRSHYHIDHTIWMTAHSVVGNVPFNLISISLTNFHFFEKKFCTFWETFKYSQSTPKSIFQFSVCALFNRGGTSLDARLGSARLERFLSRLERLEARNSKSSQSSARLELEKTACEYSIVKKGQLLKFKFEAFQAL